jgi:hypothetical protein
MDAKTSITKTFGFERFLEIPSDSAWQNAFLSEAPGVVFAFLTLAYVVSSLASLA